MLTLTRLIDPTPATPLFRRTTLPPVGTILNSAPVCSTPLAGLAVLHLGFSRDDGIQIGETAKGLGARNVAGSESVYPIGLGKPGALRYDGILVNIDRYADLEMGVDRLMRFRRASPCTFVVMATANVASDDFGHHRRAICDSTLRLPLTPSRLTQALEAAMLNHRSGGV